MKFATLTEQIKISFFFFQSFEQLYARFYFVFCSAKMGCNFISLVKQLSPCAPLKAF